MTFINKDFLLQNPLAVRLYHEVAKDLPIIDPHNHLNIEALAKNEKFENIYQLWVKPDQYKHRAMRNCGIPENLITGNAPDFDKFKAWASVVKKTAVNPLFHWSCMELKDLFGIDEILTTDNAGEIYDTANEFLKKEEFSGLNILKKWNVETLCTSDDLLDNLEYHIAFKKRGEKMVCLPSMRGDTIIAFDKPGFLPWLNKLQTLTNINVTNLSSYKEAISERLDFFDKSGCLLSDHSFDSGYKYIYTGEEDAEKLFLQFLEQKHISEDDCIKLKSHFIHFLGIEYARRNWKMQLHIGAERFTSTKLRQKAGATGGFACIGNTVDVRSICSFIDNLDMADGLPKTILYTLNPADNTVFASLTGSYSEDGVAGKIQYGPAWWFNDHYEGIIQQIKSLAYYGLLSLSIGMTTDSRSILSFLRHDYFRRILCNQISIWVQEQQLPDDWELSSTLVKNISYYNIKNWL